MRALLAALALIPLVIYSGFVVSVGWEAFITPLGVAPISVPHAIGIGFLSTIFQSAPEVKGEDVLARLINRALTLTITLGMILLTAYFM